MKNNKTQKPKSKFTKVNVLLLVWLIDWLLESALIIALRFLFICFSNLLFVKPLQKQY